MDQIVERGKPAEYGQELVKRRARITAALVSLRNRLVLDFGCGNGAQTIELAKHGCQIVACDIDPADLEVLAGYAAVNKVASVKTVLYDGTRLPAPDAHFDALVSYAVLEHVEDENNALDEMFRVLKSSGHLVMSVPNKWWIFETHGARLPLLPWNRVPFFSWLPKNIHARFAKARIYTRHEITTRLSEHGFEIVDTYYMTAPMDVVRSPMVKELLRKTVFRNDVTRIPMLSTEIFVHCRKK